MQVLSPCAGRVMAITDVNDPTFAGQLVGPGVGIEPPMGCRASSPRLTGGSSMSTPMRSSCLSTASASWSTSGSTRCAWKVASSRSSPSVASR
ncbi:PTS glucose transporter subunit IIA [Tessaracoccus defluvii]|uniref:PTS glucose transporter subunit IIA n=1 Tax=Tessaracoccus defluvii TaxID=1285901 RepID=A0A7H0H8F4_9ACTN|nr:PTS glucose transporter subunit IIA [Tessaracoccus defluvii]